MSSLLYIDAVQSCNKTYNPKTTHLNLAAEYGFNVRKFNKSPNVYISNNKQSSLFLAHRQRGALPNRKNDYRNHFTLYVNRTDRSLVICRTETTLVYDDNDAVIMYETITPDKDPVSCLYAQYKNWSVSFDKIDYSVKTVDSWINCVLLASGEWWYYDRGIILNGQTSFQNASTVDCFSLFVYYELHNKFSITPASTSTVTGTILPPIIKVTLSIDTDTINETSTSLDTPATINQVQAPPTVQPPPTVQSPIAYNTLVSPIRNLTIAATLNEQLQQQQHQQTGQQRQLGSILLNTNRLAQQTQQLLNPVSLLNSGMLLNKNDNVRAPAVTTTAVVPSIYWFDQRHTELSLGNINYFLPIDGTL